MTKTLDFRTTKGFEIVKCPDTSPPKVLKGSNRFPQVQAVALPTVLPTPPQPLPGGDSLWEILPPLLPVRVPSLTPRQIPDLPSHLLGQAGPHHPLLPLLLLRPILPRSVGLVKGLLRGKRGWTRASAPILLPPAAAQPGRPDGPSPRPPSHADSLTPWPPQTTYPHLPPLPPSPLPGPAWRGPWGPRRPPFAQSPAPAQPTLISLVHQQTSLSRR